MFNRLLSKYLVQNLSLTSVGSWINGQGSIRFLRGIPGFIRLGSPHVGLRAVDVSMCLRGEKDNFVGVDTNLIPYRRQVRVLAEKAN